MSHSFLKNGTVEVRYFGRRLWTYVDLDFSTLLFHSFLCFSTQLSSRNSVHIYNDQLSGVHLELTRNEHTHFMIKLKTSEDHHPFTATS